MTFWRPAFITISTAILMAGCFNPKFRDGVACDQGKCPSGLTCGADDRCHAGDHPIFDAPPSTSDAMPDTMQVGCQRDEDCRDPSDLCVMAAVCSASHVCVVVKKDCSSLDDACNDGLCNPSTGVCEPMAAHQGAACGPVNQCGAFDDCNFASECATTGTQSQSCTRYTCQTGSCMGESYVVTQPCSRITDRMPCGQKHTVTGCTACTGSSEQGCAVDGQQTCTCTDMACMAGTCQSTSNSCMQFCSRLQPGDVCRVVPKGCGPTADRPICCSDNHRCTADCDGC
jgi:hypothetical protein